MSQLATQLEPAPALAGEVSTTLPVNASVAYEVFADVAEMPRWLPVVQSARILERTAAGRATKVSFLGKLERGTLGYTLHYDYDDHQRFVTWSTQATASVVLAGEARFISLSARASLMVYRVRMEFPMPLTWSHPAYDGHLASAVVADFREHLRRLC
jgi:ribosome-associated toxin RatA of RatAB toxin-antitoxin module